MSEIRAHFQLKDEKVHSIRYEEVDVDGTPVYGDKSKIGGLYIRKTAFPGGRYPPKVEVVINVPDW